MEKDPNEKLGTLARTAMLEQEKIESLKEEINNLKTKTSYRTKLEKILAELIASQKERVGMIKKLRREQAVLSSRRPCFVRN